MTSARRPGTIHFLVYGTGATPNGGVRIIYEMANRLAARGFGVSLHHFERFAMHRLRAAGSLLTSVIIVRAYSLERFGIYALALLCVRLVGTFSLVSLDSLLLRMLLRNSGRTGPDRIEALMEACAGPATALTLASAILIAAVGTIAFNLTGDEFWLALVVLSPLAYFQAVALMQASLLRHVRSDTASQVLTLTLPALLPPTMIGLGKLAGWTPTLFPEAAMVVASALAAFIGARMTGLGAFAHVPRGARGLLRRRWRVVRYSSAIHSAKIMAMFVDWYGSMLIAAFQSFEVMGIWRVFQQLGQIFVLGSTSVEVPFSTEISRAHIARNRDNIERLLRMSQIIMASGGVALAVAGVIARPFIFQWYTIPPSDYAATYMLQLFVCFLPLLAGAAPSALNMMNCTRELMRTSAWALALAFVALSGLVPFFGIWGAVLGVGIANAGKSLLNHITVRQQVAKMAP